MTEPLDLDASETEARAYVEAYHDSPLGLGCVRYLVGVLAALDARDAEIAALTGQRNEWQACCLSEKEETTKLRAEIARLREVFDRTCKQHAEAMHRTCNTYQAEIARLAEQNHFFQVNYQDEIGISGLKEERDALLAQRDAEIEELQQERDQAIHSLDLRHTRFVALAAEIARLSEVERRHLGWCDACLVYHRTGNCPVTGEPPSKEAREGWSLPTPQAAPPGAERYRHKKRGTTYTIVGEAQTQVVGAPIEEGSTVTVYRSDTDGSLWVRPAAEFRDGRFERLPDVVDAPSDADVMERVDDVARFRAVQQYGDERAAAKIAEAARVADKYADNPVSGEQNNTLKAFEQGMDHQAGAVDSAVAIAAAIRSLKP